MSLSYYFQFIFINWNRFAGLLRSRFWKADPIWTFYASDIGTHTLFQKGFEKLKKDMGDKLGFFPFLEAPKLPLSKFDALFIPSYTLIFLFDILTNVPSLT